jgi:hypothetical protein
MRDWLELGPKDQCLGLFYLGWPKDDGKWPKSRRQPVGEKIQWIEE